MGQTNFSISYPKAASASVDFYGTRKDPYSGYVRSSLRCLGAETFDINELGPNQERAPNHGAVRPNWNSVWDSRPSPLLQTRAWRPEARNPPVSLHFRAGDRRLIEWLLFFAAIPPVPALEI